MEKKLICPQRLRRAPRQFSWVDQRLVRNHYLKRCTAKAWGLYLFLVTVGDGAGLSYYSERAISEALLLTIEEIATVRAELVRAGVVAYQKPFYQVLSLDETRELVVTKGPTRPNSDLKPLASILRQVLEGRNS